MRSQIEVARGGVAEKSVLCDDDFIIFGKALTESVKGSAVGRLQRIGDGSELNYANPLELSGYEGFYADGNDFSISLIEEAAPPFFCCVLRGCVLGGCVLGGCVLGGCVLGGCVLGGCVLGGCVLGGCVLGGCVLGGCVLGGKSTKEQVFKLLNGTRTRARAGGALLDGGRKTVVVFCEQRDASLVEDEDGFDEACDLLIRLHIFPRRGGAQLWP